MADALNHDGNLDVDSSLSNPLDTSQALHPASTHDVDAHPPQPPFAEDSAVTKAEKVERSRDPDDTYDGPIRKRARIDDLPNGSLLPRPDHRVKGVAAVKAEYLIDRTTNREADVGEPSNGLADAADDAAEADGKQSGKKHGKSKKKNQPGQNTKRDFGFSRDAIKLCGSRMRANEFDPVTCPFGEKCKFEHDVRKYLKEGKREDLNTFGGQCPLYTFSGVCESGWKCRFAGSHSTERPDDNGRPELVLSGVPAQTREDGENDGGTSVVNLIPTAERIDLNRHRFSTSKSNPYIEWLNEMGKASAQGLRPGQENDHEPPANGFAGIGQHEAANGNDAPPGYKDMSGHDDTTEAPNGTDALDRADADVRDVKKRDDVDAAKANRASYTEPPFLPSEKRRLYYGPETPVLAPLTTQGNMPFRRLCIDLGAQITWSEMAMGQPLIQGEKGEWALLKAHAPSETSPPRYQPKTPVFDYDNSRDFRFGAQISSNKPWMALKTTEIITSICPKLRAVDLNCGCPIDLVFRQGAGSALMDTPGKLEKMLYGMNAVSGEVPITVKIRMGTRDNKPSADKLVSRLAFGGSDAQDYGLGPCGIAAVTLHGRSRQQRYTRSADWDYISKCASIVQEYNTKRDALTDTAREPDARLQANTKVPGRLYFVGNGDCYSHEDYNTHIAHASVDSVMVARGALIKPWIFEEIASGQHLDKSASERLSYIETFVRNGLEVWGSDEQGIGQTRRFLLEWLSFACRYVPVGILEHLPPNIQDRPPAFKGRNELETLLCSDNYKDWIKISEMFLGKANENFRFVPKHKSNSYEVEAEG